MWGEIMINGMMPLSDVERCENAYIVYEYEDKNCHLFFRRRTDEEDILFEREIRCFAKVCPYFSKEKYGVLWFAFAEKPDQKTINKLRTRIRLYVHAHMPWLLERGF